MSLKFFCVVVGEGGGGCRRAAGLLGVVFVVVVLGVAGPFLMYDYVLLAS